jgi:hypothetical protein
MKSPSLVGSIVSRFFKAEDEIAVVVAPARSLLLNKLNRF